MYLSQLEQKTSNICSLFLYLLQLVPKLEYELGSLLHQLGSVEHMLGQQEGRGTTCVAQVLCKAAQKDAGIKAAIISAYRSVKMFTNLGIRLP